MHLKLIWAPIIFSKQTTLRNQVTCQIPQICRECVFAKCPRFSSVFLGREFNRRCFFFTKLQPQPSNLESSFILHHQRAALKHHQNITKIIPKDCNVLLLITSTLLKVCSMYGRCIWNNCVLILQMKAKIDSHLTSKKNTSTGKICICFPLPPEIYTYKIPLRKSPPQNGPPIRKKHFNAWNLNNK